MELVQRMGDMKSSLYNREDYPLVEGMKYLKYLRKTIRHTDNYCAEVHWNIGKARAVWKRLENILQWEGKDSRISAQLYKVAIQEVLLFG